MTTPTSDIDEASPRISGKTELVEYLEGGNKPKTDWRIGTEHEKFGFLWDGLKPLPYEGRPPSRPCSKACGTGLAGNRSSRAAI